MRFRRKLCPRCPDGLMKVDQNTVGFYYRCEKCGSTLESEPGRPQAHDPIFLKFQRPPTSVG